MEGAGTPYYYGVFYRSQSALYSALAALYRAWSALYESQSGFAFWV